MAGRRAISIVGLVALVALAGAAPASAAMRWSGCELLARARCATVRVPLDRSGGVPGSVGLRVAQAGRRSGRPALMYLSGGPGGAGLVELAGVLDEVPQLARRFRVLGFDQRGTGASGLLRCREIERDSRLRSTSAGERCARRLGRRRAFYTTRDSVADMESIRRAAGVKRLTLFGISYGTELALAYARAHPARVERLILDSVVDPDDGDPFGLASLRAIPGSLAALCPDGCAGVTGDPGADLAALTAKLRAAPLSAPVFDSRGRARTRTLRPTALLDLIFDADYNPALRAAVPAAVKTALANADAAPLLRLIQAAAPLGELPRPREFSSARYAAICEEARLPWPPGTPLGDRRRIALEHAAALGPGAFAPFDQEVAFADEIDLCLRWPDPVRPAARPGRAYPAVPTLLLQGEADIRTPPAASAAVAARIPGALRVTVPGVGHAVTGADPSGCGRRQLLRFLAGRRVRARCPAVPTGVPATGVTPATIDQLAPAPGVPGVAGRLVSAIDATLRDLGLVFSPAGALADGGGGLRGGRYRLRGGRLVLDRLEVVTGVRLSGRETSAGTLRLRVTGVAHGAVSVSRGGRLSGRLDAQPVDARLGRRPLLVAVDPQQPRASQALPHGYGAVAGPSRADRRTSSAIS